MNIRPWDEWLQHFGHELNELWNVCDESFYKVFRIESEESYDLDRDDRFPYRSIRRSLFSSFYNKSESLGVYFKYADALIVLLSEIYERTRLESFDSEDERHWFVKQLVELRSNIHVVEFEVLNLPDDITGRLHKDRTLSMFFLFHGRLKELCKYCMLRMDVNRVQRKLVEKALTRIDGELWQSIQNGGSSSVSEFFHRAKIKFTFLNNLRSVCKVNHYLEKGIAYAEKAYNPQTYKSNGNKNISVLQSLSVDLGDNDIIVGHYSLDRELEGFIATESTVAEAPVIIAFKGTDFFNWADIKTDFAQALTCVNDVYLMALGLLLYVREQVGCVRTVRVYGHSLGGGLMQFAVSSAPSGRTYGYGYNSAGLSCATVRLIPQPMHIDKIRHYRVRKDCVMATGEQLGLIEQQDVPVYNWFNAHLCRSIRDALNMNDQYINIL